MMEIRPDNPNLASNVPFVSSQNKPADTTLRLLSPGASSAQDFNLKRAKRKLEDISGSRSGEHTSLELGLYCLPTSSENSKWSSGTVCTASSAHVVDIVCSEDLHLSFKRKLNVQNTDLPKIPSVITLNDISACPAIDLRLSLSVAASGSSITSELGTPAAAASSSCPGNGGSQNSYYCNPVDCTSENIVKKNRSISTKKCKSSGCLKGARGSSGLCIAHGGGRRCHKTDCQKGAEGKSIYCKAHGGGRRCDHLGCTKSAEGRTAFCIAHGGGRRCCKDGCIRAARGKSGLCIRHGGGKRCRKEKCTKSAEGQSGLCIAHGGGKRCRFPACTKGAQGSTMHCKAHGGGKRCSFPDCGKGAEGSTPFCKGHGGGKRCSFRGGGMCAKSVHGGTPFCVAHGGGKRCAVLECAKSARGRTDYCVRHGGGKRCQIEDCGKSAQGSTHFCKAHGGGKRCSWGETGLDMDVKGPRCDRFARGKFGLCASHFALVQDHQVHGGDTIGILTTKIDKMKGVVDDEDCPTKQSEAYLPEGRVHGGSLLALLASGAMTDNHSENQDEGCSDSNQFSLYLFNGK